MSLLIHYLVRNQNHVEYNYEAYLFRYTFQYIHIVCYSNQIRLINRRLLLRQMTD
jgi:hypothetical protein